MINNELYEKAEKAVEYLKAKNFKLSTAESCTGGMVSAFITSVAGVSDVFEMGITSYSCRIKNEVLGVRKETLEKFGAVSKETAYQMAENVKKKAGADIGVSVTGVAGPASSEGHPMGYVFIGISGPEGTRVKLLNIEPISRNAVREAAVSAVFDLIIEYIKEI